MTFANEKARSGNGETAEKILLPDAEWIPGVIDRLAARAMLDESVFNAFRRLTLTLYANEELPGVEIAARVGMQPRAINYHLEKYGLQRQQRRFL